MVLITSQMLRKINIFQRLFESGQGVNNLPESSSLCFGYCCSIKEIL